MAAAAAGWLLPLPALLLLLSSSGLLKLLRTLLPLAQQPGLGRRRPAAGLVRRGAAGPQQALCAYAAAGATAGA
jgi:hypothetical protein